MTTKYYTRKAKLLNEKQDDWQPVELNRDNWWFVQFNGTLATAFGYYDIPTPPAVYVEDKQYYDGDIPEVNIYVVRPPLETPEDVEQWNEYGFCVKSELEMQANCNSVEDVIIYKIEVI